MPQGSVQAVPGAGDRSISCIYFRCRRDRRRWARASPFILPMSVSMEGLLKPPAECKYRLAAKLTDGQRGILPATIMGLGFSETKVEVVTNLNDQGKADRTKNNLGWVEQAR